MNMFNYKGFYGSIEVDTKNDCLYGKVLFINDLVTFQADNVKNLREEFHIAVDDYISTCEQLSIAPEKPFSGTFNVRIGPELHKETSLYALKNDLNLNSVVVKAVETLVSGPDSHTEIVHNYNTFNLKVEKSWSELMPKFHEPQTDHIVYSKGRMDN